MDALETCPWYVALPTWDQRLVCEATLKHPDWDAAHLERWIATVQARRERVLNCTQRIKGE